MTITRLYDENENVDKTEYFIFISNQHGQFTSWLRQLI